MFVKTTTPAQLNSKVGKHLALFYIAKLNYEIKTLHPDMFQLKHYSVITM